LRQEHGVSHIAEIDADNPVTSSLNLCHTHRRQHSAVGRNKRSALRRMSVTPSRCARHATCAIQRIDTGVDPLTAA